MLVYLFQVNIEAKPSTTEPGKPVELTIQAKPNSYVGVLGIDQSVLLLKTGNDITQVSIHVLALGCDICTWQYYRNVSCYRMMSSKSCILMILEITHRIPRTKTVSSEDSNGLFSTGQDLQRPKKSLM